MRIVCISDTHNAHHHLRGLPEGDVLVHAGDATLRGTSAEIRDFAAWFRSQPYRYKLFVPGNHDWGFEVEPELAREWMEAPFVQVLMDEEKLIEGVKFYGSPWTPKFHDWAFMGTEQELEQRWAKIPADTNILITHGPPYGKGDKCYDHAEHRDKSVGSPSLLNRLRKLEALRLHVYGHIHEGVGTYMGPRPACATLCNAAVLDGNYRFNPQHKFQVFDL